MNELTSKTIHLIGIGGAGMSAIASVLIDRGIAVQGSDAFESATTEALRGRGAKIFIGHAETNIQGADVIAASTAIKLDNPEIIAALESGATVMGRRELLEIVTRGYRVIAVSGTHGKTTTSAMVSTIFVGCGLDPSFIVGSSIANLGLAASGGTSDWFVLEADESDSSFLGPKAEIALVTNIEPDHLDFYGSYGSLKKAFVEFIEQAETAVVCLDDDELRSIAEPTSAITYGLTNDCTLWADEIQISPQQISYQLHVGKHTLPVFVPVTGMHNVFNSLGALAASYAAGIEIEEAVAAVASFDGTARRFESRGTSRGVDFIDDYAHLPSEIKTTLAAAKTGEWDRVIAVFQPHRYSRTKDLALEFGNVFADADAIFITDIYAAGEQPIDGVTGWNVYEAIANNAEVEIHYIADPDDLFSSLSAFLEEGDLCLTLGAGDITTYPNLIIKAMAEESGA